MRRRDLLGDERVMNAAYLIDPNGDRIELTADAVIGRTANQDITLATPEVSRRHAQLTRRSSSWWLQDLASKNGTFVNGEPVGSTATCLTDGDVIVFGGALSVVFHDPAATPIAPRIGQLSGVWIDPDSDAVWVDAVRIEPPLSAKQLALLQMLVRDTGEIVRRADIVAEVWADAAAAGVSDDAVGALIKRLRARLREGPRRLDYVEVVKGRGVRLTTT